MAAPPEVLQWARETLQGIRVDFEVMEVLGRVERELIAFLDAHKTTDPAKWGPSSTERLPDS